MDLYFGTVEVGGNRRMGLAHPHGEIDGSEFAADFATLVATDSHTAEAVRAMRSARFNTYYSAETTATGVDMDFAIRPELQHFASNIATWSDRYTPPANERNDRLGRFPYLSPDFAFVEKVPGDTPWIKDIHLFAIASTMSFGPSGSSINAMTTVVPKLVSALTKGLFQADVERHWASLQAYDTPQAIIEGQPADE